MIFGCNLKDKLTNVAAVIALVGSVLLVGSDAGWVPRGYEKTGHGMLGLAAVFTAFATGKRSDLQGGQNEKPPSSLDRG